VEYALLLTLVALAAAVTLGLLGTGTGQTYGRILAHLGGAPSGEPGGESEIDDGDTEEDDTTPDTVAIVMADYNPSNRQLQLRATVNGGYDPAVTLTASPGGTMNRWGIHGYQRNFFLTGTCPCTVTVTSSRGGSASVVVGP
jgi:Flp pilus assembly pilin Flp